MTTLDPADAVDLAPHRALEDKVQAIAVAKAVEDDMITAAEAAEGKEEILQMCTDTMAVYMCVKCNTPYCGGKVECADEMKVDKDKMVCHDCRWKEAQEAGGGKCSISVYFTTCYPNVGSRRLQTLTTLHSHTRLFLPAKCHSLSEQCKYVVPTCSLIRCGPSLLHSFNPSILNPRPPPHISMLLNCSPVSSLNSPPQSLNSPPFLSSTALTPQFLNLSIPRRLNPSLCRCPPRPSIDSWRPLQGAWSQVRALQV